MTIAAETGEPAWRKVIVPKRGWFDLRLQELWRYRDLIWLMALRDISASYKQTVLGPLWFILQPVLTTAAFSFLFGRMADFGTDHTPHFVFYMSGLVVWNYFADCINKTALTFPRNAQLFGKVYFPRMVVPLANALSSLMAFFIQFGLLALAIAYYVHADRQMEPADSGKSGAKVVAEARAAGAGTEEQQEKELRARIAQHSGDGEAFEDRLHLARLLEARGDTRDSEQPRAEAASLLDELEKSAITPEQRAEVSLAKITALIRSLREPAKPQREELLAAVHRFQVEHPTDPHLATLFVEAAPLFDSDPSAKQKLLATALRFPMDRELKGRINEELKHLVHPGKVPPGAVPAVQSHLSPNWRILVLPFLLGQVVMLAMGVGFIIASLTTRYRDLSLGVGFGVQLWMYASSIIFPLSRIRHSQRWIFESNPMVPIIESFRLALLGHGVVDKTHLGISFGVSVIIFFVGVVMFTRVEQTVMDTV